MRLDIIKDWGLHFPTMSSRSSSVLPEIDNDTDIDEEDSDEADIQSMNQISTQPSRGSSNSFVIKL